ncbi:MAG: tetratricopeptide repeat protein [Promethearchaeota archaeon]
MTSIEDLINKAKKLKKDCNFEEAIDILEILFKKDPQSAIVKESLVDMLLSYGGYLNDEYVLEYEKSIAVLKRIIEIDPKNYRAIYNLGIAYFNIGEMEKALKAYNEAISIKQDYKYCYYNIGLIYEIYKDNLEKALEYYEKALEIDPKFVYAVQARQVIRQKLDFLKENKPEPLQTEKIIEQLKSLLRISKKVKIEFIQDILKVNKSKLLELLTKWGEKYQIEIDGDFLTINKEKLSDLLKDLDNFCIENDL